MARYKTGRGYGRRKGYRRKSLRRHPRRRMYGGQFKGEVDATKKLVQGCLTSDAVKQQLRKTGMSALNVVGQRALKGLRGFLSRRKK
jgi:hypothetical protein